MSTTPSTRCERPLILGAGPVGRSVAAALVSRGHHPTVVTRSGTVVTGATARQADLSDPAAAIAALADATIVFSTAQPAYHRWSRSSRRCRRRSSRRRRPPVRR